MLIGQQVDEEERLFFSWQSFLEQRKRNLTAFLDEDEQKERPKDVLNLVQCQPCDAAFLDLVYYNCAKGTCKRCPKMRPHPVLMRSNTKILFCAYEAVTTCTEHGVLFGEWNGHYQHCSVEISLAQIPHDDSWQTPYWE
mmetsp:Transcript_21000/g.43184  ORF Transcript_21000/g.43184 Transcript_21000/m.43184 type:complete len:139 (-) Transcript_21000:138-554(-)